MKAKVSRLAAVAAAGIISFAGPQTTLAEDGPTLKAVKERGEVLCGVHQGRYGFAIADSQGKWKGLDVDYCKAVAAAVLGDANKVKFSATWQRATLPRTAVWRSGHAVAHHHRDPHT